MKEKNSSTLCYCIGGTGIIILGAVFFSYMNELWGVSFMLIGIAVLTIFGGNIRKARLNRCLYTLGIVLILTGGHIVSHNTLCGVIITTLGLVLMQLS
jgi:hypothetical protein